MRIVSLLSLMTLGALVLAGPSSAQDGGQEAVKIRVDGPLSQAVTVYSEVGFRGRSEEFRGDDKRLDDNRIGNDGAVSIRIPAGCRASLHEHFDYRGRSIELERDVADLGKTRFGRREASSIRVSCRSGSDRPDGPGKPGEPDRRLGNRRGAIVFSETDFRGRFQFFDAGAADLSGLRIGDDSISSVRVAKGCRLKLYTDRGFQGKSAEIRQHLNRLRRTAIGPDTASSLLVECAGPETGVTLFSDSRFRGQREVLRRHVSRLADSPLGDDRVGSVRVPAGCRATLFAQPGFRGQSVVIDQDTPSLVGLAVGPDDASSVRVDCIGPDPGNDDSLPFGSGVVLFDRSYFDGPGVSLRRDAPRLDRLPIGNDRASSIRIAPGCAATLYRDAGFRGPSVVLKESVQDLDRTRVGSNELSSIQVKCRGDRRR